MSDLNILIEDVRSSIKGAQPSSTIHGRLAASLRQPAARLNRAGTMRYRLAVAPATVRHLTPEQSAHLYSIAVEAMGNSLRHSGGRQVAVSLQMDRRQVCLKIQDDRVGLLKAARSNGGQGFVNMEARARKLGADLRIASLRAEGTLVHLDIPVPARAAAQRRLSLLHWILNPTTMS